MLLQTLQGDRGRWGSRNVTECKVERVQKPDVIDSGRGKGPFGRNVMLQSVQGGKWSSMRDVRLLTVQGRIGSFGRDVM